MLTAIAAKDNVSATVEVKNIHLFWDNAPKYLVDALSKRERYYFIQYCIKMLVYFFSNQA